MQLRLGITTIFVTHDQLEAMTLSDEVAVMNGGRIEQIGPPREVYEHPRTRYVMDFLGNVNHLPAKIYNANGALRAQLAGGQLTLPFAEGWSDGEDAVLAFRSEAIAVVTDGGQVTGTVERATYLGGAMEYLVRVGEASLRVRVPADSGVRVGSVIALRLAPAEVSAWRKAAAPVGRSA
jgi:iron(III) transport system ATP-binding protein